MNDEKVILVDEKDIKTGEAEKLNAHRKALLHRAFSIFVLNSKNEMMLQQRAFSKYHTPGLWTNTCCGHPKPGEQISEAAHRRLKEEMGFDCNLKKIFDFVYKAELDNGLTEHEFDHVFIGYFNSYPKTNPTEVANWKWEKFSDIEDEIKSKPENFTVWFRIAFDRVKQYLNIQNK